MMEKSFYEKYVKRILDVLFSIFLLIVLSWLILIISIIVRIKLGSPIIFKQQRPGKDNDVFNIYKFRTMTDERDQNGKLLPDDVRLTKFGRLLRSSSMDELPELWNILIGEMSFVGPRPLLPSYIPYYKEKERIRHEVRPGLTGWAQINGRNATNWDERLEQDIYYVENMSFILDLKILFKTIGKVIKRSDILVGKQIKVGKLSDVRSLGKIGSVSIRKFTEYDVNNKVKWINNPENNIYLHYDLPLDKEETFKWFERIKEKKDRLDCIIEYNNVPVGVIGLLNIKNSKAEYYITLGEKKFKGKGISKIASKLLIDFSKENLNLKKIYAYTEVDNIAAQRLLESLGFAKSNEIDKSAKNRGRLVHRFFYSMDI